MIVSRILRPLAAAGRHGPSLLAGGVLIGLLVPQLADIARPFMGFAVFAFTLGAFLKVEEGAFRFELCHRKALTAVLTWSTFGVPFFAFGVVQLIQPGDEIATGILLAVLAPPVGSAAAIATMLGLSASLALFATVVATMLAPFYLPPLAALLTGATLTIDPYALSLRLATIVGGAALTAWMLRRFAGRWVDANPNAMTGISVLGLIAVSIGAMHGMQQHVFGEPVRALLLLGLAFIGNAGMQALGALLFVSLGRVRAMTVGLVTGNRNVTLVWAATGPFVVSHPDVELFLAMSVFPIFMLPVAMQRMTPLFEYLERIARSFQAGSVPKRKSLRSEVER
jgi:BASS family bile acid:Na+ symporter